MAYSEKALHNEGREPIMRDVRAVLSALRDGSTENPEILAIDAYNVMLSLNHGFPKHMYHETLDPVVATDKQDEKGLKELGYSPTYIYREYPRHVYRRNFHPRFALQLNQHGMPLDATQLEFIETRTVKTEAELNKLKREPKPLMPMGIQPPGPWCLLVTDIPPIEAETEEDRQLQIARLQGQVDQANLALSIQAKNKQA